jgi:cytochrome c biogenesis protein CcmG, thiol:disulfide interchange protein DsbE
LTDPASTGDETRDEDPPEPSTHARPRRLRALVVGLVLAAVLAAVLFVGLGRGPGSSSSGPVVGVGSTAPDFTIPSLLGGAPVDLALLGSGHGRPVVLNFFASWCIPCQQETPLLARTAKVEQARGDHVQFVGVDVSDPKANAVAFVHQAGITYPVGADTDLEVAESLYGLNGEPNTFFIDSSGRVVGHVIGPVSATQLSGWLHRLDGSAA